jgi:hypothetical protein
MTWDLPVPGRPIRQTLVAPAAQRRGVPVQVEGRQDFVLRQLRVVQQPCHASIGPIVGFLSDQFGKISHVVPTFSSRTFGNLEILFEE